MEILYELLRIAEIVFLICTFTCITITSICVIIGKITNITDWLKNRHEFRGWIQEKDLYTNAGDAYKKFLLERKIDELTQELYRIKLEAEG